MGVRCADQLKAKKPRQLNIFKNKFELAKLMILVAIKHDPDSFDNHMYQCLNNTRTCSGIVRKK